MLDLLVLLQLGHQTLQLHNRRQHFLQLLQKLTYVLVVQTEQLLLQQQVVLQLILTLKMVGQPIRRLTLLQV